MASYRLHVGVVSRGNGQNAIAKAAYNSREAIRDERTGEMKDYRRKTGIEFSGIFAPKDAPAWAHDRAQLWNMVEWREDQQPNRKNRDEAQLARNVELSIPHELNADQRRQLVRDFVREQFVRRGMIADVAIHAPDEMGDERNYHAHVLLTMRVIDCDQFANKKNRDWNSKAVTAEWRQKWAELGARYLEKAGFAQEAERYSYAYLTLPQQRIEAEKRGDLEHARALDREATTHHGPHVSGMERRGVETEIGNAYRDTLDANKERSELQEIEWQIASREKFLAGRQAEKGVLGTAESFLAYEPANQPVNDNEPLKERLAAFGYDPAKPSTVEKWLEFSAKVDDGQITEKDRFRNMSIHLWHEADRERRMEQLRTRGREAPEPEPDR